MSAFTPIGEIEVFRRHGILPNQLTAMDRLAYVGGRGMGALEYAPASSYAPASRRRSGV